MPREYFVSRKGARIDPAGVHIHHTVCGVLNAVHDNEAVGRPFPDGFGDSRHINRHAGYGTGLDNGGDSGVFSDLCRVVLRCDHCLIFIMSDADIFFAGDGAPADPRTGSCGMLEGAADHVASGGRPQDRRSHQAEEQFGPALASKHHAFLDPKESLHVFTSLVDDSHQLVRGGVIPALVIRNR